MARKLSPEAIAMIEMLKDMSVVRNRKFAERAVTKMLERQTADERTMMSTTHNNGIGFNGSDAAYCTWAAEFIAKSRRPEGERLMVAAGMKGAADRHYVKLAGKLVKYVGQLLEEAEKAKAERLAKAS
jgi:hypothetical protein